MLTMVVAGRVTMPAMGGRADELRAKLDELEAETRKLRASVETAEDYLALLRTAAKLIEQGREIRDDLVRARTELPVGSVSVMDVARAAGFKSRQAVYDVDARAGGSA